MFFWKPDQPNNWWPKLSPDGRFLAYGNVQNWVVDLRPHTGLNEATSQLPIVLGQIADDGQVLGFLHDGALLASKRDSAGVPTVYYYELPSLTKTPIYQGPAAFGTEANASGLHWATFPNGPGYVVDAAPYTPVQVPASGLSQDGAWISYQTIAHGRALPVVENVLTRESRIVDVDGINYARVFSGPDGGYLFYASPDGKPYINAPGNITLFAGLPNCGYGEGFGALAWRGEVMWVWTYSCDTGKCLALGRPYGEADAIQLDNLAAADKTMQVGQGPDGWTVAGCGAAGPGTLGCWGNVPYDAVRTPYGGSHDGTTPIPPTPLPPTHTIYTFDIPKDATQVVLNVKR